MSKGKQSRYGINRKTDPVYSPKVGKKFLPKKKVVPMSLEQLQRELDNQNRKIHRPKIRGKKAPS